jgi:hypothetical protein
VFAVKVIADSISRNGARLTTMQISYPRFVHAEFMTHRVFSRNASSSRAIPVAKMIDQVRNNPAMPVHWGKNQPGMQAAGELEGEALHDAKHLWTRAAKAMAECAEVMSSIGLHKQVANRLLEPFQWMHTIVTATEWDNFFALRCHPAAEPNIQKLAYMMREARQFSAPVFLSPGEWHMPYVEWVRDENRQYFQNEGFRITLEEALAASTARCARVSYLNHDGTEPNLAKDMELYERLVGSDPIHASPTEHQATPDTKRLVESNPYDAEWHWARPWMHGNLVGWEQHRKFLERKISPSVTLP